MLRSILSRITFGFLTPQERQDDPDLIRDIFNGKDVPSDIRRMIGTYVPHQWSTHMSVPNQIQIHASRALNRRQFNDEITREALIRRVPEIVKRLHNNTNITDSLSDTRVVGEIISKYIDLDRSNNQVATAVANVLYGDDDDEDD